MLQLLGLVLALAVGGAAGLGLRLEHLGPTAEILPPPTYARVLTLHGLVMVYLVLVPGISGTVGSHVLPKQLGADELALPRLHRAAFHLWLVGALFLGISAKWGGTDLGFTFLPPLGARASAGADLALGALVLLAVSAVCRSVVMIASVHGLRAAEVPWRRTTPLAWSVYAHSVVMLVASPVLALTASLLIAEHALGGGTFYPSFGGDPTLFRHCLWFGVHGVTYSALLPALGVSTEILTAFAHRPLVNRRSVLFGIVGLALVSVVAWGSHLPTSGHTTRLTILSSLLSLLGAIPAAGLVGAWCVTLSGGARLAAPLVFALGSGLCFLVGTLSGLFLGVSSLAMHLHGTAFVVGHSHLLFGSFLLALLGAVYFWWPMLTGSLMKGRLGRLAAVTTTLGVLGAELPLLLLGARGLPRRMATYPNELQWLEQAAGAGAIVLTIGVGLALVQMAASLWARVPAGSNPWDAPGREWTVTR